MKKLLSGIILLSLLTSMFLTNVSAEEAKENLLTVSGDYTVVTVADEAFVSIGVKTNNVDYKLCQEENKKKMNDVISAIKALGIEEKFIKTTTYESVPIYEYEKTDEYTGIYYNGTYYNKRIFKEYQLTHMIRVNVTDVSLVGKLIDITVERGINELNNVQFSISRPRQHELYLEALKGAAGRAIDKAKVLAEAFGIQSIKIKSINTDSYNPYSNYSYNSYTPMAKAGGSAEDAGYTSITSGELQVSATVSIIYTY